MYQYNSQLIQPGDIFICLPGGEPYITDALARGATEYIKMNRAEMAKLANDYYDYPSKKLQVIGVTGTNGKTTVTYLISQVLQAAGYVPYVLGTINSSLTTPESLDIQRLMVDHLAKGGTHFIMEVSSHGIAQSRILGIQFAIKILTNITQDHLDFHKTFEAYKNTKLSFMAEGNNVKIYPEDYKKVTIDFNSPLLGQFNVENMQSAFLALQALKIPDAVIKDALSKAKAPPGRFESIQAGQPYLVIVDYAHTPDGLEKVLLTAKKIAKTRKGRLITVFGCGGDRDRTKRGKMGFVVSQFSDFFVITSDNPRTESQAQITQDIIDGIPKTAPVYQVIEDRKLAIQAAIGLAQDADVVVLAGKGHENYQILKAGKIHFDDREEAQLAIQAAIGQSA